MSKRQQLAFEEQVNASPSPVFIDAIAWQQYHDECTRKKRMDSLNFARVWCRLIHRQLEAGCNLETAITSTYSEVIAYFGFEGPGEPGYLIALGALERCWVHGKELRAWHSSKFGP